MSRRRAWAAPSRSSVRAPWRTWTTPGRARRRSPTSGRTPGSSSCSVRSTDHRRSSGCTATVGWCCPATPSSPSCARRFDKDRTLGQRSIIVADLPRISDSCGYSLPLMDFREDRDILDKSQERRDEDYFQRLPAQAQLRQHRRTAGDPGHHLASRATAMRLARNNFTTQRRRSPQGWRRWRASMSAPDPSFCRCHHGSQPPISGRDRCSAGVIDCVPRLSHDRRTGHLYCRADEGHGQSTGSDERSVEPAVHRSGDKVTDPPTRPRIQVC